MRSASSPHFFTGVFLGCWSNIEAYALFCSSPGIVLKERSHFHFMFRWLQNFVLCTPANYTTDKRHLCPLKASSFYLQPCLSNLCSALETCRTWLTRCSNQTKQCNANTLSSDLFLECLAHQLVAAKDSMMSRMPFLKKCHCDVIWEVTGLVWEKEPGMTTSQHWVLSGVPSLDLSCPCVAM